MAPAAVVVGPPGAGKTTVGKAVAELLGVPFADTDHLIEARAGKQCDSCDFQALCPVTSAGTVLS